VDLLTPPLPRELQVEVTASCNLRCPMCLVAYREPVGRISGAMPLPMFRRLLDELPVQRLTLQGLGEPLLCPDLPAMVDAAVGRGIECGFNTNGTLLDAERARLLVGAGLSWIHVSVDGATPETYERIRIGSSFSRVARNLAGLVAARRAAGSSRPEISVVTVLMRRNVHELPALVDRAVEWGVDELWVQALSHSFDDVAGDEAYVGIRRFTDQQAVWTHEPEVDDLLREAEQRAERHGLRLRTPRPERPRPPRGSDEPGCTWPWDSAYVRRDGGVQPCCVLMGEDRAILGRLDQDDFASVWHGRPYQEFRPRC
jgi:MoaA/NifB/PqqE/SkfB family radical SAM enzyme